ncbi:TetR/AcrR family transcriptional regulator [Streptomyces thinghirensis]|nr:TetR/AcrR family transcriptional regulator [Streptomyces thinghirensis]
MTVQALYHYFPNRDALVTALITKAYGDLADAQAAVDTAVDDPSTPRLVTVAEAYPQLGPHPRAPTAAAILYGHTTAVLRGASEGPTTQAVRRMGAIFQRELFRGVHHGTTRSGRHTALSSPLREHLGRLPTRTGRRPPPPAVCLFLSAWGHLHGLVVLEVFGIPLSWASIRPRSSTRRSGSSSMTSTAGSRPAAD